MPRPSGFTQEIVDEICERLSEGESLRKICLDEHMPNKATVFRWLSANKEFSDQYAYARDTQADVMADEILDIADDASGDSYIDDDGVVRNIPEVVARSKLRVDARKWVASKLKPKVYGEKTQTEVSGPNGGPLVFSEIRRVIVDPK